MRLPIPLAAGLVALLGTAGTLAPLPSAAAAAAEAGEYTGVVLEWVGSSEMQHQPPSGTSNYFSAGVSDGTEATYLAVEDDVEILQIAADGTEDTASYATRAAHTAGTGEQRQLARWGGGHAVVAADGSAVIEWTGSLSVNFYDGLVPFTLTDPVLTVGADGTGELVADLDGYTSSIADPEVKEPLDAAADVTVATFSGVTVDTESGFVVVPDYAGVEVETGSGTPQNRTVSVWGAWPQEFVDFQLQTGLSSYFYSSGGVFDPRKPPLPFAVGFDGAVPELPPPPPTPDPDPDPEETTAPPRPTADGYLAWGVRSSFRSYIAGPIAKGSIALSGGATTVGSQYRFHQTSASWNSGTGAGQYGGAVRFTGHEGVLDLSLSSPSITVHSASSATLYVSANGSRIAIGSVSLGAASKAAVTGGVAYANAPVTLSAAGASLFAWGDSQFYPAGTAMDPVTFVIGRNSSGGAGGTIAAYQPVEEDADSELDPDSPGLPLIDGCTVEGASLGWGFKESFRAYIDGSIANGSWEASGGATYETPSFGWPTGTGTVDPETGAARIDFTGSVRFTGHDGLLDTTIANPVLLLSGIGTANPSGRLFLDVSGVTMEDAMSGAEDIEPVVVTAVPFVDLDLAGGALTTSSDGLVLTGEEAPATITAEGFAAFPNYEAGTAFDPVSFTIALPADCSTAVPAEPGEEEGDDPTAPDGGGGDGFPLWLTVLLTAIGGVAIGGGAVALVLRSRRSGAA